MTKKFLIFNFKLRSYRSKFLNPIQLGSTLNSLVHRTIVLCTKLSTLNLPAGRHGSQFSTNKGFTLIELLVVMGIIGVLATGLMITLDPLAQMKKGRDAQRKSDLALIQRALEEYYNDNSVYPTDSSFQITGAAWGAAWGQYMRTVPKDPDTNRRYIYDQVNSGQGYYLYASIERGGRDTDSCQQSVAACKSSPDSNSCRCTNAPAALPLADKDCDTDNAANNSICNYGVSSSNLTP